MLTITMIKRANPMGNQSQSHCMIVANADVLLENNNDNNKHCYVTLFANSSNVVVLWTN